jgi:hypothetical protein
LLARITPKRGQSPLTIKKKKRRKLELVFPQTYACINLTLQGRQISKLYITIIVKRSQAVILFHFIYLFIYIFFFVPVLVTIRYTKSCQRPFFCLSLENNTFRFLSLFFLYFVYLFIYFLFFDEIRVDSPLLADIQIRVKVKLSVFIIVYVDEIFGRKNCVRTTWPFSQMSGAPITILSAKISSFTRVRAVSLYTVCSNMCVCARTIARAHCGFHIMRQNMSV